MVPNVSGAIGWIVHSGVIQGIIMGATFAFLTAILVLNATARRLTRTVDGWRSIPSVGKPENGVLARAATAKALPMVNIFEEAAYWTTTVDADGHRLRGTREYVLRFPAGGFPPAHAFWSLTVTDVVGYMVSSPIGRSSFDDRSPLAKNTDGAVDVLLQHHAPTGSDRNWLPTPAGRFKVTLRAYLPGEAVLDGGYRVPAIARADS